MEKWFIINITSLEVPEGLNEFYFGTLADKTQYFKERNCSKERFERILHDQIATQLLIEHRPEFNLIFVISTPISIFSDNIPKQERCVTPFVEYLDNELRRLTDFVGVKPHHVFLFEVDEHFEEVSIRKNSSDENMNTIYDLDQLNAGTQDYKVGQKWNPNLLEKLRDNKQKTNLAYILSPSTFFYFRFPIKGKNRTDSLNNLFSLFQIIIENQIDLNDGTIKKGRFQELNLESNSIRIEIPNLIEQVTSSLNQLKTNIDKRVIKKGLTINEIKQDNISEEVDKIANLLKSWNPEIQNLNCDNAKSNFDLWQNNFDIFLSEVDINALRFLNFLKNKYSVVNQTTEEKKGNKFFWNTEKNGLSHDRERINRQIKSFKFNQSELLIELKENVYEDFKKIEEELERCPNTYFLAGIFIISLIFYLFACSTVLTDFLSEWLFILISIIYTLVSFLLFNYYRTKSIKSIKKHLENIKSAIESKGKIILQKLEEKKDNQLHLYELDTINKNFQGIEDVFNVYKEEENHISLLQGKSTDIGTIGLGMNGVRKDFRFKENITESSPLSDYLNIYNKSRKELKIEVEKDKSPQTPIDLRDLKINALKKIMITTAKQ